MQKHQVNTGAEPIKPYHHFRYLIAGIRRTLTLASLLSIVVLAFICATPAYADTRIWLNAFNIVGPSQVVGHVGDIPLTSYSQNASNGGVPARGGVTGSVCGQVTITKLVDNTSPIFLGQILKASLIPRLTITFEQQNGTTVFPYYTVVLETVLPTSMTQSDSTTDIITEQIVLSAQVFRFKFDGQNPDGSLGQPVSFGFDCARQTETAGPP